MVYLDRSRPGNFQSAWQAVLSRGVLVATVLLVTLSPGQGLPNITQAPTASFTVGPSPSQPTTEPTTTTQAPTTSQTNDNMSFTFVARDQNDTTGPAAGGEPVVEPVQRYNLSTVQEAYETNDRLFMEEYNLSELNEEQKCYIRIKMDNAFLDFDSAEGGRYCGSYYDGIFCWSATAPGLVNRSCPAELNKVYYETEDDVTRFCLSDGTWDNGNKSDYSLCTPRQVPDVSAHDDLLKVLVYIGYSLSFTALIGAFCIFILFRSLRCVRNYIHWNLVSSFILLYISFFTTTGAATAAQTKPELQWLCRLLLIMMMYAMMTNFFWMFVEGVYLYTLVVQALSVRRNRFWIYCVFGWGGPLPFVIAYIIVKKLTPANICWVENDVYSYIIVLPIFSVIAVNLYFLIHIMAILVTKLRASHSLETQQYRKGVKGTLFLLPLLGVTYLLFFMGPVRISQDKRAASFYVYQYVSTALSSLQGFFVAVIYVFLNQEVQNVIKRKLRRWREENTLPTRVVSRRGSNPRNSIGNIFVGRRNGNSTVVGDEEKVAAFKLPAGSQSPELYSNGVKAPPFIRLDEIQPLSPSNEAPKLYPSIGSLPKNGDDARVDRSTASEVNTCNEADNSTTGPECNELPLLSVSAYNEQLDEKPEDERSGSSNEASPESFQSERELLDSIPNGNNNNSNSLSRNRSTPPSPSASSAARNRVTFADELVHEPFMRPACCIAAKSSESIDRLSPTKLEDRGHPDGDESPESNSGKQDPQRSPLIPCIRKKRWAGKPNGTIAFPKAPEGTPV